MANEKRLIDANALLEKFQFRLPINDHISENIDECVKMARRIITDAPTEDAVSKGLYDQIKWERDVAISQLERYGISLGEKADAAKVVRCEKCRYYEKAEYDNGYKMVCRLLKRQTAYNGFCYCGAKMDGDGNDI